MTSALVVGIGHPDRGDDGIGPAVVRRMKGLGLPGVELVERTDPIQLLDLWSGEARVVVVDAVRTGDPPGTVLVRDATQGSLPTSASTASSHALDLPGAVELARALGSLPASVVLVGVVGARFAMGEPMTDAVRRGLDDAVRAVVSVVGQ